MCDFPQSWSWLLVENCRACLHTKPAGQYAAYHVRGSRVPRHPSFPWYFRQTKTECCKADRQMISPKSQFDHMNAADTGGTQLYCYMGPLTIKSLVKGRSRVQALGWDTWKVFLHPSTYARTRAGIPISSPLGSLACIIYVPRCLFHKVKFKKVYIKHRKYTCNKCSRSKLMNRGQKNV